MMLEHIDERKAAARVFHALCAALGNKKARTKDLEGRGTTEAYGLLK